MKKFMNKIRKNNKGFTLVELIIVIAVIAILTAVAAPQYIKYVEKSRVAKDENNAGSIRTAIETAIIDNNSDTLDNDIDGDVVVTFTASGISTTDANLQTALEETLGGEFNSNLNNILTTTQKTKPNCTLTFDDGKFKEIKWEADAG